MKMEFLVQPQPVFALGRQQTSDSTSEYVLQLVY